MSQYPPPPSFRGPFNPNPQLTPSSSAAHHVMPQFPYHPFRDSNNQTLPSAQFPPSYSYNATSHGANASMAVPGAQQAQYMGFGQTSNGSFPPPPYPPIPPPYALPQQPSLIHHREPSLGLIQPHNSLPLKPPPVAAMTGDANFEKSQTVTANISELEDGELSDGELGESASSIPKTSRHSAKRDNGSPSKRENNNGEKPEKTSNNVKADHEKGNRGAKISYSPHESSPAHSLNNLATQVPKPSNPQELAHTAPPPPSFTDNFTTDQIGQSHRNSGDSRPSSQSMIRNLATISGSLPQNTHSTHDAADLTDFPRNDSPQEDVALHRKWQDLHDRAKDALKQLYDDGIGFVQIANEGIDPTVLRNLYTELGIPVPLAKQADQNGIHRTLLASAGSLLETTEPLRRAIKNIPKKYDENNAIDIPKKPTESAQNPEPFKDSPNASSSKGATNHTSFPVKENISKLGNKSSGGNKSAHDSHPLNIHSSNLVSKPTQTAKAPNLVTNNLLGKPTTSRTYDKALERKDYIARMLAAKAGKPISAANSAVSPSASINRLKETTPKTPLVGESQQEGIEERCVYVDNFPYTATEGDFKNLFSGYDIESVSVEETLRMNKSTGAGVVVLSSATEAQRAISELSGKHIQDGKVSIQLARKTDGTAPVVEVAVQAEDLPAAEVVSASTSKSEMDAKANKKAQTELALQKIEALKNRGNVPPPTDVHRGNVQGALSSQEQQNPVEESQSKLMQQEPLASSKPMAISQIQGSFFTSANRTPAFGKPGFVIPGLFMDSAPLETSTPLEQPKIQSQEAQDKLEVKLAPEVGSSEPENPMTYSQIPAVVTPQAKSLLSANPEAQKQKSGTVEETNESKKRQKAADFIDSPSTRVRRPLGQNEETSVIIEISEDETNGDTEDENMDIDDDIAMDIDEENVQHTPPKQLFSTESTSGKPKSIRELPPLSDFPGRKKISSNTAVVTPPAAQTPSKIREAESLKIKEKKIELMNRRIAELEQRIKAKQTASRAHTPGTPGSSAASPKLSGVAVGSHDKPRSGEGDNELNRNVKGQSEDPNLKEAAEIAEAAKFDATKAAGVVETSEIAATTQAAAAIATAELAKAAEAAEASKVAEYAKAAEAVRLAELAKAAEAAEAAKLAELARAAEAAEVAKTIEQERLLAEQKAKIIQVAKADAERLRAEEVAAAEEEKQRQARRAEIESGLPILDAEVERTKRKLELLKKEVDDLSREVHKGIEGRRILMEELNGLTPPPKPSRISQEQAHVNGSGTHAPEPVEERQELSSFDHRIDPAEQQQNVQDRPNGNNVDLHSPLLPVPADYSPETVNDLPAINEDQDVMDTSPDGLDDAEATDYSPEPPTNIPVSPDSVDAEEVYEPPVTVDTNLISPASPRNEGLVHEMHIAETAMLQTAPSAPHSDVDGRRRSQESEVISNSANDVHAQYEPPASIRSTNFADASDSDDYEPPEPTPPVENTLLSPINAASDIVSSLHDSAVGFGPRSHSMPADSITIIKEQMEADDTGPIDTNTKSAYDGVSNAGVAKFTPYESPLKQFKSYRYHPDYLSEVPCGFRSLTYSHGIDPKTPVCRFEAAGGVCNDNSCDGQHFRNMSLSDDMVLVQMGAIPEGLSSQEGDAYANGLRRIIQEIRGRKVRDFNAVASEITAYRAKFLGDNLKVLPL